MSFLGKVSVQCPNGCDPQEAEIWSFIDGEKDETLKESLLAGDLNLLSCVECRQLFFPEATVIYFEPSAQLLAFVFPESYQAEEPRWRKKMEEDAAQLRTLYPESKTGKLEPIIFFGIAELQRLLNDEEILGEESAIAAVLAHENGQSVFPVDRSFARTNRLPWLLPYRGAESIESLRQGLEELLKNNDRLSGYQLWPAQLKSLQDIPPKNKKNAPAKGTSRHSNP